MTEKKFSENLSGNKALSDNFSNNLSPSLNLSNDFLGIGKMVQAYFDYKKYKISITEKNIESLHHLVRKDILTTQTETKKFIDKIFKLYEKGDVKISLATLRVIEYMDDELLGAVKHFFIDNKIPSCGYYDKNNKQFLDILVKYSITQHGQPLQDRTYSNPCLDELINLVKLTNQC